MHDGATAAKLLHEIGNVVLSLAALATAITGLWVALRDRRRIRRNHRRIKKLADEVHNGTIPFGTPIKPPPSPDAPI